MNRASDSHHDDPPSELCSARAGCTVYLMGACQALDRRTATASRA